MYHLSVKTISRASGRSATAAAAYRSGSEITDERTGEIHDYTRKQGVEHSEIILPKHAPEWANNREQLWNAAEQAETRKNSTVAREFEVAIPKDLTPEQGRELVRDFTQQLVEKHGFAAEYSIHQDHKLDWQGQQKTFSGQHAHILCSTRRLEPEGFTEKTRELDGGQSGRENVEHWREKWANTANEHLKEAGHEHRIDHRSLKDQGIDREPTQHLGPAATAQERRGEPTQLGDINRRIEAAYERGLADRAELAKTDTQIIDTQTSLSDALRARDLQATFSHANSTEKSFEDRQQELKELFKAEPKPAITREQFLEAWNKPEAPGQEKDQVQEITKEPEAQKPKSSFEAWFEKMESERKQHLENEKNHEKDGHGKGKDNGYDYDY